MSNELSMKRVMNEYEWVCGNEGNKSQVIVSTEVERRNGRCHQQRIQPDDPFPRVLFCSRTIFHHHDHEHSQTD